MIGHHLPEPERPCSSKCSGSWRPLLGSGAASSGALTSAPRPVPSAPGRAPSGQGFAWVTIPGSPAWPILPTGQNRPILPTGDCPGLILGLGWHARESLACAARHARTASRAWARCHTHCTCAHTRWLSAQDAARNNMLLDTGLNILFQVAHFSLDAHWEDHLP